MLGKYARVKITNPIGSVDKLGRKYPLNFGSVIGKEKYTAFVMGIDHPVKTLTVVSSQRFQIHAKSLF